MRYIKIILPKGSPIFSFNEYIGKTTEDMETSVKAGVPRPIAKAKSNFQYRLKKKLGYSKDANLTIDTKSIRL